MNAMWPIIEGFFLAGIFNSTSQIAQMSAMPEFVKEADWLAKGFYSQIRRKSGVARFYLNTGMILAIGLLVTSGNDHNIGLAVVLLFIWAFIASYFQKSAMKKASRYAWNIIQQKKLKEDHIRETMYQASAKRLSLR
jgi:hypothetical protein